MRNVPEAARPIIWPLPYNLWFLHLLWFILHVGSANTGDVVLIFRAGATATFIGNVIGYLLFSYMTHCVAFVSGFVFETKRVTFAVVFSVIASVCVCYGFGLMLMMIPCLALAAVLKVLFFAMQKIVDLADQRKVTMVTSTEYTERATKSMKRLERKASKKNSTT